MIDNADLLFVFIVATIITGAICIARKRAASHIASAQKAKLFSVRDDLIFLVGEGKLSEDDKVFQHFYGAINSALRDVRYINLKNFVMALSRLRQDGIDPAEERNLEALRRDLMDRDPAVRRVTNDYFRVVIDILVTNSWQLSILIRFGSLVVLFKKIGDAIGLRNVQRDAYGFYRDYDRALQG